ncbi:RecX family transcriptional regulator [Candidatus Roizmanbacteria bacterium]|nr:RecX family transcriptional regulator [Candidatus Roizmanbacteria bacterium]
MDNLVLKALSLAYFFLKFRARTEKEVKCYLDKKSPRFHFDTATIQETIKQLKEQGYVDDKKFVDMYVKDRTLLKPRSTFLLQRELLHLGVSKDLIEEYFSQHETDESALALKTLNTRKTSLLRQDEKTRFKKAISYLLRKGFTYDVAKKAYEGIFLT